MSRFIESSPGKNIVSAVVAETSQVTYNECSANSVSGRDGVYLSFVRILCAEGPLSLMCNSVIPCREGATREDHHHR